MAQGKTTLCSCCGKMVSRSTEQRHRSGKAPMLTKVAAAASSQYFKDRLRKSAAKLGSATTKVSTSAITGHLLGRRHHLQHSSRTVPRIPQDAPQLEPAGPSVTSLDEDMLDVEMADTRAVQEAVAENDENRSPQQVPLAALAATEGAGSRHESEEQVADAVIASLQGRIWAGRTRRVTVEEVDDDDDEEGEEDADELQEEPTTWGFADEDRDPTYDAISAWDRIHEHFLCGASQPCTSFVVCYHIARD